MIIIVCGVSGTGKSTIGQMLSDKFDLAFLDADDFHPESNVQKMSIGMPLNDDDRQPWLETLSAELSIYELKKGAVLACSALKESYRKTLELQCKTQLHWVILNGSKALLTERLNSRKGHFVDSRLLDSQLDTLELPDYGLIIDVQNSPEEIINEISNGLVRI